MTRERENDIMFSKKGDRRDGTDGTKKGNPTR